MKFVKSGFAQKLIIILIALMIFNIAVPKQVHAWDLAGVLFKPIASLILGILVAIDVTLGVFLIGSQLAVSGVGDLVDEITDADSMSDLRGIKTEGALIEDGDRDWLTGDINVTTKQISATDFLIGPDTIFCGKVAMLDANIFQANSISSGAFGDELNSLSLTYTLKKAISKIYVLLRNISAAIMLIGLVFCGIRILLSSNHPQMQAQWKQYLMDWLLGLVLLIFMHVLMYGIFYVSDTVTYILSTYMFGSAGLNASLVLECLGDWSLSGQLITLIMLGYLIYLTVIYAIAYFKRLLWVCILIVFAPVMAVLYSFGRSTKQIFSRWMKEYVTTVFVQPYHMLVYSVLVSLPLTIAGGSGTFDIGLSSLFTLIYALIAMSFIRPAEKYMRGLMGMDKGIANMASFDSGKQTLSAVVDTVKKVAQFTISPGTSILKGEVPFLSQKQNQQLANTTKTAANIAGAAAGVPGAGDMAAGIAGAGQNGGMPEDNSLLDGGSSRQESPVDGTGEGGMNSEGINAPDSGMEGLQPNDKFDTSLGVPDVSTPASELSDEVSDSVSAAMVELKGNKADGGAAVINASNVTLNADKISGADNNVGNQTGKGDTEEAVSKEETNNDDRIKIANEGEEEEAKPDVRKGSLLSNFMRVTTGQQGVFETLEQTPKTKAGRYLRSKAHDFANSEDEGAKGKIKRFVGKAMDPMNTNVGQRLSEFEKQGGMQALHEGFNSIRDTFYVDGGAPQDWKSTNARMGERVKERQEKAKVEMTKKENIKWLIEDFEIKLKKENDSIRDPNRRLSDLQIHNKAKELAQSKATKLADTYVPLGVMDLKAAYECDEDCKEYGLTPKEAVSQRMGYEKFNIDSKNVTYINDKYGSGHSSVNEAIGPQTRDYYNNGYTDIGDMSRLKDLTTALNVSIEKGMQLDQVLRKKGGTIDYSNAGLTPEKEKVLKKILEQYGK